MANRFTPLKAFCGCLFIVSLNSYLSDAIRVKTDGLGEAEATKPSNRRGYYERPRYGQDRNTKSGNDGSHGTNIGVGRTRYGGGGDGFGRGRESGYGYGRGGDGYGSSSYGDGFKGDGGYPRDSTGYDRNAGHGDGRYPPISSGSYFPSGVYPPGGGIRQASGGDGDYVAAASGYDSGRGSYGAAKSYQGGYQKGYNRPRPPPKRGKWPKTRTVFIEVPIVHVVPVPVPSRPVKRPRPDYKGDPYPRYPDSYDEGFGGDSGPGNRGFEITLSFNGPDTYKGGQNRGPTYSKGW